MERWKIDKMDDDHRYHVVAGEDNVIAYTLSKEIARRIARLPELEGACDALLGALGLRRPLSEILADFGELGVDAVKRARAALEENDE